jgi:hypothetical protein
MVGGSTEGLSNMIKVPLEDYEQESFINELRRRKPDILLEINPAAGMKLTKQQGAKVRRLGYQAGALDVFMPEYHCYVEMKRVKGGSLTPEQRKRIPRLQEAGYTVIVARGAVDAVNQLKDLGIL